MTVPLIDTHAHLDDKSLIDSFETVVGEAATAGVEAVIAVGCTLESSRNCIELAQRDHRVFAAVGIQPNYVAEAKAGDFDQIIELSRHPRVRAIGETGIDCYWDDSPLPLQHEYFARHLELSREMNLPFIVHMRDSGDEILTALRKAAAEGPLHGVMHSFTGDGDLARECLDLGLHISFAGMLTFKKSQELRAVAKTIPLSRLLLETDSPYLSPEPFRGKRPNRPARVVHTAECLAETLGIPLVELAHATTRNAQSLFRLNDKSLD